MLFFSSISTESSVPIADYIVALQTDTVELVCKAFELLGVTSIWISIMSWELAFTSTYRNGWTMQ